MTKAGRYVGPAGEIVEWASVGAAEVEAFFEDQRVGRIWRTGRVWRGRIGAPDRDCFLAGRSSGEAKTRWLSRWRNHRDRIVGYEIADGGVYLTGGLPLFLTAAEIDRLARELAAIRTNPVTIGAP